MAPSVVAPGMYWSVDVCAPIGLKKKEESKNNKVRVQVQVYVLTIVLFVFIILLFSLLFTLYSLAHSALFGTQCVKCFWQVLDDIARNEAFHAHLTDGNVAS